MGDNVTQKKAKQLAPSSTGAQSRTEGACDDGPPVEHYAGDFWHRADAVEQLQSDWHDIDELDRRYMGMCVYGQALLEAAARGEAALDDEGRTTSLADELRATLQQQSLTWAEQERQLAALKKQSHQWETGGAPDTRLHRDVEQKMARYYERKRQDYLLLHEDCFNLDEALRQTYSIASDIGCTMHALLDIAAQRARGALTGKVFGMIPGLPTAASVYQIGSAFNQGALVSGLLEAVLLLGRWSLLPDQARQVVRVAWDYLETYAPGMLRDLFGSDNADDTVWTGMWIAVVILALLHERPAREPESPVLRGGVSGLLAGMGLYSTLKSLLSLGADDGRQRVAEQRIAFLRSEVPKAQAALVEVQQRRADADFRDADEEMQWFGRQEEALQEWLQDARTELIGYGVPDEPASHDQYRETLNDLNGQGATSPGGRSSAWWPLKWLSSIPPLAKLVDYVTGPTREEVAAESIRLAQTQPRYDAMRNDADFLERGPDWVYGQTSSPNGVPESSLDRLMGMMRNARRGIGNSIDYLQERIPGMLADATYYAQSSLVGATAYVRGNPKLFAAIGTILAGGALLELRRFYWGSETSGPVFPQKKKDLTLFNQWAVGELPWRRGRGKANRNNASNTKSPAPAPTFTSTSTPTSTLNDGGGAGSPTLDEAWSRYLRDPAQDVFRLPSTATERTLIVDKVSCNRDVHIRSDHPKDSYILGSALSHNIVIDFAPVNGTDERDIDVGALLPSDEELSRLQWGGVSEEETDGSRQVILLDRSTGKTLQVNYQPGVYFHRSVWDAVKTSATDARQRLTHLIEQSFAALSTGPSNELRAELLRYAEKIPEEVHRVVTLYSSNVASNKSLWQLMGGKNVTGRKRAVETILWQLCVYDHFNIWQELGKDDAADARLREIAAFVKAKIPGLPAAPSQYAGLLDAVKKQFPDGPVSADDLDLERLLAIVVLDNMHRMRSVTQYDPDVSEDAYLADLSSWEELDMATVNVIAGAAGKNRLEKLINYLQAQESSTVFSRRLLQELQWYGGSGDEQTDAGPAVAFAAILNVIDPIGERKPGYLSGYSLFSAANKNKSFKEIREELQEHLSRKFKISRFHAEYIALPLIKRFVPELLLDTAPNDFVYEPGIPLARLRAGIRLVLVSGANEVVVNDLEGLLDEFKVGRAAREMAAPVRRQAILEWAVLQKMIPDRDGFDFYDDDEFSFAERQYQLAENVLRLKEVPDRIALAATILLAYGIDPMSMRDGVTPEVEVYLDAGKKYAHPALKGGKLIDVTREFESSFDSFELRAQQVYQQLVGDLFDQLPAEHRERLNKGMLHFYGAEWNEYKGKLEYTPVYDPDVSGFSEDDWSKKRGRSGAFIHVEYQNQAYIYEIYPERKEVVCHNLTDDMRKREGSALGVRGILWGDLNAEISYRKFNNIESPQAGEAETLPYNVSEFAELIELRPSVHLSDNKEKLINVLVQQVLLQGVKDSRVAYRGMTSLEEKNLPKARAEYFERLMKMAIPYASCVYVRSLSDGLECALDLNDFLPLLWKGRKLLTKASLSTIAAKNKNQKWLKTLIKAGDLPRTKTVGSGQAKAAKWTPPASLKIDKSTPGASKMPSPLDKIYVVDGDGGIKARHVGTGQQSRYFKVSRQSGRPYGRALYPQGKSQALTASGIESYASNISLDGLEPNAVGMYRVGNADYVQIDGRAYQVRYSNGVNQWQVIAADRNFLRPPRYVKANASGVWEVDADGGLLRGGDPDEKVKVWERKAGLWERLIGKAGVSLPANRPRMKKFDKDANAFLESNNYKLVRLDPVRPDHLDLQIHYGLERDMVVGVKLNGAEPAASPVSTIEYYEMGYREVFGALEKARGKEVERIRENFEAGLKVIEEMKRRAPVISKTNGPTEGERIGGLLRKMGADSFEDLTTTEIHFAIVEKSQSPRKFKEVKAIGHASVTKNSGSTTVMLHEILAHPSTQLSPDDVNMIESVSGKVLDKKEYWSEERLKGMSEFMMARVLDDTVEIFGGKVTVQAETINPRTAAGLQRNGFVEVRPKGEASANIVAEEKVPGTS